MLIKLGIVTTGVALFLGGTAQAAVEPPVVMKPPSCQSAVQIGSIATVSHGGEQVATIRQYEGCGAKFGHIRVQGATPFRASVRLTAEDGTSTPLTRGELNQRDVWTTSKVLNDKCSAAVGTLQVGNTAVTKRAGYSC